MTFFQKVIKKMTYVYMRMEKESLQKCLGKCGDEAEIQYPFVIDHPELISIGDKSVILKGCRMQIYPELAGVNATISIGGANLIGYRFCILAGADVYIGDQCSIASDVTIVSENHGMDPNDEVAYGRQPLKIAPVSIGDGCWIGDKVIILPGVTIGDKCIIGAGSVVTHSIPAMSIAVGNPARVIKQYDLEKNEWKKI